MTTLKIFGDSILKGVVYAPTGRQYSLCKEHRAERMGNEKVQILNYSKMGATVTDGLRIMENDPTPTDENTVVIIEFGGNDCNFQWNEISENPDGEHFPNTLPEEFSLHLKEAVRKVKEKGAKAIIALAPPIHTEKFFQFICKGNDPRRIMQWLKSTENLYHRQEYYTRLAHGIACEENCEILDLRAPFLPRRDFASLFCEDGTHPNSLGHGLICQEIKSLADRLSLVGV